MPDPKALTPDQIELLRGLPTGQAYVHSDNLRRPTDDQVPTILDMEPVLACFDGEAAFRTEAADILLATIDTAVAAERERVQEIVRKLIYPPHLAGLTVDQESVIDWRQEYEVLTADLASELDLHANPQETDQ